MSDEEEKHSVTSMVRKSFRQSVRQSVKETESFNRRESMRALSRRHSRAASIRSRGGDNSLSISRSHLKGVRDSINN